MGYGRKNPQTIHIDNPNVSDLASQLAEKATKEEVANALDGSPKGAYATLATLQTAYPTGTTGIYVVQADGHIYSWDGAAWADRGLYQSVGIAEKAVTLSKVAFTKPTKNLFNKETITTGYYINPTNGNLVTASASYKTSDYIPVSANTTYSRTENNRIVFYDSNKVYLSGNDYVSGETFTTPANCAFVRVSFTVSVDTYQFELGSVKTSYEPYLYMDLASVLKNGDITNQMLNNGAVSTEKANFITIGKNLFNKAVATLGYYINDLSGALAANASYYASDYIPISPNTVYTETYGTRLAFYDSNKTYISGLGNGTSLRSFTTPANAAFLRCSADTTQIDTFQLEQGSTATLYEPFGYKIVNSLLEKKLANDTISVFLPSEICVAVGRTIELYNSQVAFCGNINNFHFKWDCSIGKAMKRKFSIAGTTPTIGEYPLTLSVYDNNMNLVATASTTIKIVSATITNTKNILTIGDSLSNDKPWYAEVMSLSGSKFGFVGTKGTDPTYKHEGRSGFSAANYLTATPYTFNDNETYHHFWDGTRFNYAYYKTTYGINPDAVQIYLGTNGMALDPTVNAGNIKQIVDYIRQDDATIPIFLVFTLYRGNQDGLGVQVNSDGYTSTNKGAWKVQEDAKVFNLISKLYSLLSGYTNLHFVPIALAHDSEYNFGAVSTPVNPRASQTELLPTEATHPQLQGYLQKADIMFSVFAKYLSA